MKSKESEEQNTSFMNVKEIDKQDSGEKLIDRHPLEGTPFHIHTRKEEKFLCLGIHRMSPGLATDEEVYQFMSDNTWIIIAQMIIIYTKGILQKDYELEAKK